MVRNVFACDKHFMASWDQSLLKLNVEYRKLCTYFGTRFCAVEIVLSEATVMTSYVNMKMNHPDGTQSATPLTGGNRQRKMHDVRSLTGLTLRAVASQILNPLTFRWCTSHKSTF